MAPARCSRASRRSPRCSARPRSRARSRRYNVPVYAYRGVTTAGKKTRGHLDAESPRSARARLRRDGVFLTDLEESHEVAAPGAARGRIAISLPGFNRVSTLDLALAT